MIENIEHFKSETEEFETYLEWAEHLFVNFTEEDMKVSMFTALEDPQVYQVLHQEVK